MFNHYFHLSVWVCKTKIAEPETKGVLDRFGVSCIDMHFNNIHYIFNYWSRAFFHFARYELSLGVNKWFAINLNAAESSKNNSYNNFLRHIIPNRNTKVKQISCAWGILSPKLRVKLVSSLLRYVAVKATFTFPTIILHY